MEQDCLPFPLEYKSEPSQQLDPENCFADLLESFVRTEQNSTPKTQPLEVTYAPTKKTYGLTHHVPQENPSLDDLLTSVL